MLKNDLIAAKPMRCPKCNAPRSIAPCFKCGSDLIEPHPSWTEPRLPPVDKIRRLAEAVGYAIGVHGSQERDLDLIAAPWVDEAVSAEELAEHIATYVGLWSDEATARRIAAEYTMSGAVVTPLYARSALSPTSSDRASVVEAALAELEQACDALAGTRSRETYLRMVDVDKASDALIALDNARIRARSTLEEIDKP